MTREEYERTVDRMCDGKCNTNNCVVKSYCEGIENCIYEAYDIVQAVEKWGKEHPVITNQDKFKEMFGMDICLRDTTSLCFFQGINQTHDYGAWLKEEYQEPINKGWIPYSKKEPEKEGKYLVCYKNGVICLIGYYDNDFCGGRSEDIVAWKPLPKPYQEPKGADNETN